MPERRGARVELRGLSKQYPKSPTRSVDGIDLVIEPGEFMTFLGPSGSGKTTTLNMIAGFVDQSSGSISIDGTDVSGVPTFQRNIGVVFQNYSLFPHMSVRQNIAYPLKRRKLGKAEIDRLVGEALDMVHLAEYGSRRPKELSGGQQQRVALARALVFRPPLLLLDEPLGALDKGLREIMQREISAIHDELGITFLFVTHDQEEALAMSDRIAIFNEGRIAQVGVGKDMYRNPQSRFVAQFLGESNVFEGEIVSRGERTGVRHGGLTVLGRTSEALAGAESGAGRALVVLRPEHLVLGGDTDGVPGEVRSIVEVGPVAKVFVAIEGGQELIARVAANDVAHLSVGRRVAMTWDPDDAYALPAG